MIPTCGETLLRGPKNSFDYVVRLTSDEKQYVSLQCHRCVLIAHSRQLGSLIYGENFWDMDIKVKHGYLGAAIELIQYLYLKDVSLISEKTKVLELCALFEMPADHFLIRSTAPLPSLYPTVKLVITADESESVTAMDFIKMIKFEHAKLVHEQSKTPPLLPVESTNIMETRESNITRTISRKRKSEKETNDSNEQTNSNEVTFPYNSNEVTHKAASQKMYNLRKR